MNLFISGLSWENGMARARIGLIANNEDNCNLPDSFLGFGTSCTYMPASNSAGNYAPYLMYNDTVKNIKTIGYIMVR